MTNRLRLLPVLTLLFILLLAPVLAICATSTQTMSYEDWVEQLKKQALSQGISQDTIQLAFLEIKQIPPITSLTAHPAHYSAEQYLSPQQIEQQKKLLQEYGNMLFEINHLFGVEPEVLVALWALDNSPSSSKSGLNVIELLASSSFHQPNNKTLQTELFHALKLLDDKQVNPATFTCNEFGLLGTTFFKPSTLRKFGIDHDGDGVFNVWTSHADIFASSANYLNSLGWKAKEPWGMEIQLPEGVVKTNLGLNFQYSLDYWRNIGIKLTNGNELPENISLGAIVAADAVTNKTYLVLDNFFTLLRWKRSIAFALAIGQTIDQLAPRSSAESTAIPSAQPN